MPVKSDTVLIERRKNMMVCPLCSQECEHFALPRAQTPSSFRVLCYCQSCKLTIYIDCYKRDSKILNLSDQPDTRGEMQFKPSLAVALFRHIRRFGFK